MQMPMQQSPMGQFVMQGHQPMQQMQQPSMGQSQPVHWQQPAQQMGQSQPTQWQQPAQQMGMQQQGGQPATQVNMVQGNTDPSLIMGSALPGERPRDGGDSVSPLHALQGCSSSSSGQTASGSSQIGAMQAAPTTCPGSGQGGACSHGQPGLGGGQVQWCSQQSTAHAGCS